MLDGNGLSMEISEDKTSLAVLYNHLNLQNTTTKSQFLKNLSIDTPLHLQLAHM